MYHQNERTKAIKEIQKYLGALPVETPIVPNGIYDGKTKDAVAAFQKSEGLTADGKVGYLTFQKLYEKYKKQKLKKIFEDKYRALFSFPIKRGAINSGVRQINDMLAAVMNYYGKHTNLRISNVFSRESAESALEMRRAFLLDGGDYIDEILLDRIMKEYSAVSFFKNNGLAE